MIDIKGVSVRIDGRNLLSDVTLQIAPGSLTALVGPNGAGKSTLLSVVAGDLRPTTGTVTVGGLDVTRARPADLARERAVLPQQNRLSFPFTVREVAAMGRTPWAGISDVDDDFFVDQSLVDVCLSPWGSRVFLSLSGGEQARASLARVLAQRTGVLLLDEPTAALDLAHQERVMEIAGKLAAEGVAVLAVLHDLSLAAAWSDRIALMADGQVKAVGPPPEVLTEDRVEAVYGLPVHIFPHPLHGGLLVTPRRTGTEKESPR